MATGKRSSIVKENEVLEFNIGRSDSTAGVGVRSRSEEQQHNEMLSRKREEKKQKDSEDSPNEKKEAVMHGAELKCQYAQGLGTLFVTSNEINLQDQPWATEGDGNNMVNLQFKGTCGHPKWAGKPAPPCMSVIKLSPWQKLGNFEMQVQKILLKESYITCDPTPNVAVPKPIPQAASIKSTLEEADLIPKILNAYFVKWAVEKGTEEADIEVYDKKLKKKVPGKKKVETKKINTEIITERGLGYQIALIIETINLTDKKIKVKIKSAKRKVLSDVDADVEFIDMKDIEAIKDVKKYDTVKPKKEFEITVGELSKDITITNGALYKDRAVVRLMFNKKADDLSFDMAELIMADADKSALLYAEVECTEPKTEYDGVGDNKNRFMYEEGKNFSIKYFEQPWVVKAREEQKLGVNEASYCSRIVDEYHQINRQNKPSACANTDNSSWCASFVGWCLSKSGYSAQLDPGAFSYGHEQTRYRVGAKKNPSDKKVILKEEWGDPVWGKLNVGNKVTLGAVCVLNGGHHVSIAVGMSSDGKTMYYLGGNQGNSVCVGPFGNRTSCIYPIEYVTKTVDSELPIYYRKNEKLSH